LLAGSAALPVEQAPADTSPAEIGSHRSRQVGLHAAVLTRPEDHESVRGDSAVGVEADERIAGHVDVGGPEVLLEVLPRRRPLGVIEPIREGLCCENRVEVLRGCGTPPGDIRVARNRKFLWGVDAATEGKRYRGHPSSLWGVQR